jgi:hypothetical protein
MRLIGLLLTLALIALLVQRLYGGPSQLGPTGRPAITEPIQRAEEAMDKTKELEQEREKKTMGEFQPGTNP